MPYNHQFFTNLRFQVVVSPILTPETMDVGLIPAGTSSAETACRAAGRAGVGSVHRA